MTFEEAIRKSMKAYWEKTEDFEKLESSKDRKYTKKYFDSLKNSVLNKDTEEIEIESKSKKTKAKGVY